MTLAKYNAANLDQLMDRINKNSIGMDEYFDRVFNSSTQNYPPYNVIQVNSNETRLEIALAGFKKEQVNAYTEYGKLFVKGEQEDTQQEGTFVYKGLAQRNFESGHPPFFMLRYYQRKLYHGSQERTCRCCPSHLW